MTFVNFGAIHLGFLGLLAILVIGMFFLRFSKKSFSENLSNDFPDFKPDSKPISEANLKGISKTNFATNFNSENNSEGLNFKIKSQDFGKAEKDFGKLGKIEITENLESLENLKKKLLEYPEKGSLEDNLKENSQNLQSSKSNSQKNTGKLENILGNLLLFGLIAHSFYYFWNHFSRGTFTLNKYLPLHICNLAVYLLIMAFLAIKFNKYWQNKFATLVYYWGLVPAFLALIFPDLQSREIWNFEFIEFFWSHFLIVASCFYLLIFANLIPKYKFVPLAVGILMAFGLILIFPLNLLLGSNYMYLNRLTGTGPMSLFPTPPLHLPFFAILLMFFYSIQFGILKLFKQLEKIRNLN